MQPFYTMKTGEKLSIRQYIRQEMLPSARSCPPVILRGPVTRQLSMTPSREKPRKIEIIRHRTSARRPHASPRTPKKPHKALKGCNNGRRHAQRVVFIHAAVQNLPGRPRDYLPGGAAIPHYSDIGRPPVPETSKSRPSIPSTSAPITTLHSARATCGGELIVVGVPYVSSAHSKTA